MRKQWRKRAAAFCLAAAVAVSCLPASVPVLAAESEGSPDRLEVLGGEETGTAASAEVQNGAFSGGFEQRPDTANLTKQGTLDWVRLDSKEFGSFNRKNTTEPAVTDLSLIGTSGDLTGNADPRLPCQIGLVIVIIFAAIWSIAELDHNLKIY